MRYKNKVTNERQNSAFVLVIRSVDCEIQTFRPESSVAEIEDSHVNYYRKIVLHYYAHIIKYRTL